MPGLPGRSYTSENIAIGGRPLGAAPESGPATVWVNPVNPAEAVLWRRPSEMVFLGVFFAVACPFFARFVWTRYA
ncbi:hypothetical protein OpiT1DRAFT_03650 [Opitutaceae bacterium TAV1]|nr:hypothetical protein OPIT5_13245 [Opitutaceae bacterium TAV5]EIP99141.1 hypothetical protein OpiT1DRAFT_03650 [Opitutaceae bacterium TAV1]